MSATNASILERNIVHAFAALDDLAPITEDAFWRFRNAHAALESEARAYLQAKASALHEIAARVIVPLLPPTDEPARALRVRIELDDFARERIHHAPGPVSRGVLTESSPELEVAR